MKLNQLNIKKDYKDILKIIVLFFIFLILDTSVKCQSSDQYYLLSLNEYSDYYYSHSVNMDFILKKDQLKYFHSYYKGVEVRDLAINLLLNQSSMIYPRNFLIERIYYKKTDTANYYRQKYEIVDSLISQTKQTVGKSFLLKRQKMKIDIFIFEISAKCFLYDNVDKTPIFTFAPPKYAFIEDIYEINMLSSDDLAIFVSIFKNIYDGKIL